MLWGSTDVRAYSRHKIHVGTNTLGKVLSPTYVKESLSTVVLKGP